MSLTASRHNTTLSPHSSPTNKLVQRHAKMRDATLNAVDAALVRNSRSSDDFALVIFRQQ